MLTDSFALGYYGKPRMTRDLDFVVALMEKDVDNLVAAFAPDFYIDEDSARSAIRSRWTFNLIHLGSAIKVGIAGLSLNAGGPWNSPACRRGSPAGKT
jgi:hypothetical protein